MNAINLAKKKYLKRINKPTNEDINKMSYQFCLFKANIIKFFPSIEEIQFKNLFLDLLYHKWLSGIEQYEISFLRNTKIINHSTYNIEYIESNKPLIFTTFHLGSYRLINSYLFELGYKIVIIIDESVYIEQQNDILANVKPLLTSKETSDFIILNVKDTSSIFKLKEYIKMGYVMTVYLDGNTGLSKDDDNFSKGFIPISFFGNEVFVKNGIGKLAYLLNADIIPTISHRDNKEINCIEFYKEISISDYSNAKDFPIKSIEKVYQIFENKLINYKMQWESWLYIHKWFKRNYTTEFKLIENIEFIFNTKRYSLFTVRNSFFIFDLFDYKSYPINKELYDNLSNNSFKNIENKVINELIAKNIII
jgi:lauroyl/myristoyl acyltransferase